MKTAAVLLAAGLSSRFGKSKIAALLDGVPLGLHAAHTIARLPVAARIVIISASELDWPGFIRVRNLAPDTGLSGSIQLGVAAARSAGAEAMLIALADMPFVPAAHFEQLLAHSAGADTRVATGNAGQAMPPALFGKAWFDALATLSGDSGAHDLLRGAMLIEATPATLIDIDSPADLKMARHRIDMNHRTNG